jgi:hypothetical protein
MAPSLEHEIVAVVGALAALGAGQLAELVEGDG